MRFAATVLYCKTHETVPKIVQSGSAATAVHTPVRTPKIPIFTLHLPHSETSGVAAAGKRQLLAVLLLYYLISERPVDNVLEHA